MTKHTINGADLYCWKQWALELAKENNVDANEIDWLLQGLTSLSNLSLRLENYQNQKDILSQVPITTLSKKWQQRINNRTPVQYLVGETPWRDFSLSVTPDVLIPRPETELIIDIAKDLVEQSPIKQQLLEGHWADLGTGSGAIAIALAKQFPRATIHAVDISEEALTVARFNALQNSLANHIKFYKGSWLSPISTLQGQLCGILSNPPYIPTSVISTLQVEVRKHEPHLALDGGMDGLSSTRTLIKAGATYLKTGGVWILELMANQAENVVTLLEAQNSYIDINIHEDMSGIQRFVSARKA